ncbi:protein virilizer homolog isoform X3 [Pomacea canaliculata]|uniref:protein virilizer homolog isoform X3 n=1 Tax=Pomacea canaliculata TaxID=400727 RepID=UPI000D72F166|nr:protein virilizer homolog isoform X3 [Pomacea canaliculata]
MADAGDSAVELLFFDTFSHENTEELNLDLVQFPCPVIIYEVRIIPLRAQVQANLAGGVRLGATNPSAFKLELFVNNLTRPNSATFEKLGLLDYKENTNIQLKPEAEVPTDGLVLKGWYNTVTVAVYGCLTTIKPVKASPPPPPPPIQRKAAEPRHEPSISEEELCKSAPGTQHPLDYIQQQLKQLQHHYSPSLAAPTLLSASQPVLPAPPTSQPPSSRDIFKPFEQILQLPVRVAEPQDQRETREQKRDFTFPPEPKEPYETQDRDREPGRDLHDESRSRDSRDRDDWEYRRDSRNRRGSRDSDSRDGRDYMGSREGSHESRDVRERERERTRYREREEYELEREREQREQREREREKEREKERERERDREIWERERERESWEQEDKAREQREAPREQREAPREQVQPRTPPIPQITTPPERSVSRSPSRSQSPVVHSAWPPEPPMPPEEEMETNEPAAVEEGEEDVEMYENLSPDDNSQPAEGFTDAEPQEEDGYEDISSDDELNDAEESEMVQNVEFEEDLGEESWTFSTSMFNPLQCYLAPLGMFRDPSLSPYELEVSSFSHQNETEAQQPPEAQSLLDVTEQLKDASHTERWVSLLDTVPPLLTKGLSYLVHVKRKKNILETLVSWTMEGLDENAAMKQPEAAFKVRHLKMGISLSTALLQCDSTVAMMLLIRNVQHCLLDLLENPCMAFSIRLLILRALDASLRFPDGVSWFLGLHSKQDVNKRADGVSCYQRLVQLMNKKQVAQVMMGYRALVRKANAYDTFMKLRAAIDHVLESLPSVEEDDPPHKTGSGEEEEEMEHPESNLPLEEEDVDKIVGCLEEIYRLLDCPQMLICQPTSLLPVKTQMEKMARRTDLYPALFRLAYHSRLLECLFVLLSTPATASQSAIFVAVRSIIRTLLHTQEGLLFLSTRPDTTNGIIRSLVQMTDEACEEAGVDMVARQLGLEMVYHLQTLQYVDQLFEYQKKVGEEINIDASEPLGILHSLYSMTFTPGLRDCVMGRRTIAHVLGLANNLSVLLPFIQPTGDEARDAALRKSVCWGYTSQLISMIVVYSEGTQLIEKFGSKLLAISESCGSNSKLAGLQEWLAPLKKLEAAAPEKVGALTALLKTYAEDVGSLLPGLITTLRFLHALAIPASSCGDGSSLPLHNKQVLLELFSADCFPVFVSILQKLSEIQLKPWQLGAPQSLDRWTVFFAAVTPALAIVRTTLSLIIQARGSEFKDLTVLSTLLELHTVVCAVPSSSLYSNHILQIQRDIVDALMAFTQPSFSTQGEEALSSSLWTLMMKELLRYPLKSPYVYMSGLLLLSELVPLPFPLLTKEPLSEDEVALAVNTRKLWSAHLHPLMPDVHNLIGLLAGTGCQPLLCLLRRVCWQIADLAAPSATMIARCLLDIYLDQRTNDGTEEEKKEGEKDGPGRDDSDTQLPLTTKILGLISYLLSQPGIKSAMLELIGSGSAEDKYRSVLPSVVQTMNTVSSRLQHVQAQEACVSVLQSLCDQEITLVASDSNMPLLEQLACTLPEKELMVPIVTALLEHISNPSHSYASLLPCVRTLVMLTEHDYGFYHLKMGLEANPSAVQCVLRRINNTFSKDSSDCLSTLSAMLELLRLLVTVENTDEGLSMTRTRVLSKQQLCTILDWGPGRQHSLHDLQEMSKEDETLESLSESITSLVALLKEGEASAGTVAESWEVTLPPCRSLLELFSQRSVYSLTDTDDDRLSVNCWLANPALDEPDAEPEVIKCDLLAWCQRYLSDFDLQEELKKDAEERQEDIVRPKRPRDRRKSQEVININRGRPGKKPFVAPMRGRGIMTQGMVSGRGHDLFRSRPPNTSRPPSMHVDDFVKLENRHTIQMQQPPLQLPVCVPPPMHRDKDVSRGRGQGGMDRGRGAFSPRGRFFTPPANYPRREENPHGGHSPQIFATPHIIISHRPKPTFAIPAQFSRGGQENLQGMMMERRARDMPFSGRGRTHWFGGQGKEMDPGFLRGGGGGAFQGRDGGRHMRSFTK